MPATTIVIGQVRLELDVRTTDSQLGPRLLERTSQLFYGALQQVLSEELAGAAPHRVPQLVVELVPVAADQLERQLPQLLRAALQRALPLLSLSLPPAAGSAGQEPSGTLEALRYFLAHGRLPWQHSTADFTLDAAVQRALRQSPGPLRILLKSSHEAMASRRLARQLTPGTLIQLLNFLEPAAAPLVQAYLDGLLAAPLRSVASSGAGLQHVLWELVLREAGRGFLLTSAYPDFMARQLRQVAAYYQQPYARLVTELAQVLPTLLPPAPSQLAVAVTQLARRLPTELTQHPALALGYQPGAPTSARSAPLPSAQRPTELSTGQALPLPARALDFAQWPAHGPTAQVSLVGGPLLAAEAATNHEASFTPGVRPGEPAAAPASRAPINEQFAVTDAHAALVYYLRHQSLPPGTEKITRLAIVTALRVVARQPATLRQLARLTGAAPTAAAIVRFLPGGWWVRLLRSLAPVGRVPELLWVLLPADSGRQPVATRRRRAAHPMSSAALVGQRSTWQQVLQFVLQASPSEVDGRHLRYWLAANQPHAQMVARPAGAVPDESTAGRATPSGAKSAPDGVARPADATLTPALTPTEPRYLLDYLLAQSEPGTASRQLAFGDLRHEAKMLLEQAPEMLRLLVRQHLPSPFVLRNLAALVSFAGLRRLVETAGRRVPHPRAQWVHTQLATLLDGPIAGAGSVRRQLLREAYLRFHLASRQPEYHRRAADFQELLTAYRLPARSLLTSLHRRARQMPALPSVAFFAWLQRELAYAVSAPPNLSIRTQGPVHLLAAPEEGEPTTRPAGSSRSGSPTTHPARLVAPGFVSGRADRVPGLIKQPAWRLRVPLRQPVGQAAYHLAILTTDAAYEAVVSYLAGRPLLTASPSMWGRLLRQVAAHQPRRLKQWLRSWGTMAAAESVWERLAVIADFASLQLLIARTGQRGGVRSVAAPLGLSATEPMPGQSGVLAHRPGLVRAGQPIGSRNTSDLDVWAVQADLSPRLLQFVKIAALLVCYSPASTLMTQTRQLAARYRLPWRATLARLLRLPPPAAHALVAWLRQCAHQPASPATALLPATALPSGRARWVASESRRQFLGRASMPGGPPLGPAAGRAITGIRKAGDQPSAPGLPERAGPAAEPLYRPPSEGASRAWASLAGFNTLLYYLEYGRAPWWQPASSNPQLLADLLRAGISQQPAALSQFIVHHAHEPQLPSRLAALASFSQLHELLPATRLGQRQQLVQLALIALDREVALPTASPAHPVPTLNPVSSPDPSAAGHLPSQQQPPAHVAPTGYQARAAAWAMDAKPPYLPARLLLAWRTVWLAHSLAGPRTLALAQQQVRRQVALAGLSWRGALLRARRVFCHLPALAADPFFEALFLLTLRPRRAGWPRRAASAASGLAAALPSAGWHPAGPSEASWSQLADYLRTGLHPPQPAAISLLLCEARPTWLPQLRGYLGTAVARDRLVAAVPLVLLPALFRRAFPAVGRHLAYLAYDWLHLQTELVAESAATSRIAQKLAHPLQPASPATPQAATNRQVATHNPLTTETNQPAVVGAQQWFEAGVPQSFEAGTQQLPEAGTPAAVWAEVLAVAAGAGPPIPKLSLLVQRLLQAGAASTQAQQVRVVQQAIRVINRQPQAWPSALGPLLATLLPAPPPRPTPATVSRPGAAPPAEPAYVVNGGLVLLWPFLVPLFERLGYLDQRQFKTPEMAERAVHLLYFLATGEENPAEHLLVVNKLLSGVPDARPVLRELPLLAEEKTLGLNLLQAVLGQWSALKNTSIAGLRQTFLQRAGKLSWLPDRVTLAVQTQTVDVLLNRLPWSVALIKLPWMALPLYVTWQ